MEGVLKATFKSIMSFIIIIIVFDLSLFLYDVYSVYSKVNNMLDIIEKDVAENNGLPDTMAEVYNGMLDDIAGKSYVVHSYGTNFSRELDGAQSLSYNGDPTSGADVVVYDYGDIIDIKIKVRLGYSLAISNFADENIENADFAHFTEKDRSVLNTKNTGYLFSSDIDFTRSVPALRYLK